MGLLGKIFTGKAAPAPQAAPPASDYAESAIDDEEREKLHQRRDVVQRVLLDTMQKHGIPSDWIDCRIVVGESPGRPKGMHVQLIVRQGQDRLLTYIFAFQESFRSEFARAEPRSEWLHSLAWEFAGAGTGVRAPAMPPASAWVAGAAAGGAVVTAPAPMSEYAAGEERLAQEQPFGGHRPGSAADIQAMDDLEADLQALYAIRDAALKPSASSSDQPDFEPTRPADSF
jgi:hypothetical protein